MYVTSYNLLELHARHRTFEFFSNPFKILSDLNDNKQEYNGAF